MNKKYQVFVSSTFRDLQEARGEVFRTLYEMDCIAAGMELFPAIDEEQFEFIKRVIDDSDYYLILVGNRYGSLSASGLSYTELEYDYAVSKNLKVVALLHDNPKSLPVEKSDVDPVVVAKLELLRQKLRTGRLVKSWSQPSDLPGIVAVALQRTITTYPGRGWVRGDGVSTEDLLLQLNTLRAERDELQAHLQTLSKETKSTAPSSVQLKHALGKGIDLMVDVVRNDKWEHERRTILLIDVLQNADLPLFGKVRQDTVQANIARWLAAVCESEGASLGDRLEVVAYALEKLGLISLDTELEEMHSIGMGRNPRKLGVVFWSVTPTGRDVLIEGQLPEGLLTHEG